jgi:hypothetical protein
MKEKYNDQSMKEYSPIVERDFEEPPSEHLRKEVVK